MPSPLGNGELIEYARALLLGGTGLMGLVLFVGIAAYLVLCARSTRVWDGHDRRWRRP